MQALSKTNTGELHTIKWMFGTREVLDFMRSRDIKEGSTIKIIQKYSGGLIIGNDHTRIAIDDSIAERIQV